MGSQGEVGQGFSQLWPSLEACLAFFLYLCLSVVAGLEGLSHREHEARAFWHGFTFLGLSLSLSYWFHRGGRLGSWGEIRQNSLNSNYDITLSRGGWARFPPLWSYFWPSFTCVCRLLLGWTGCSISSMKKELFDIVFTSSVVFTISYWFHLGGRAGSSGEVRQGFLSYGLTIPPSCSCLLLLGWKGCPIRIMTQHLFGIVFTLLDVFHYFANWMPQQFMKLIQNGTPKWMHLNFAKGLRTHGFGALQSKLQMQNCLLMNMWHIHLHNGRRIISKQMSCLLRNCLPPYIVNLCILQYVW